MERKVEWGNAAIVFDFLFLSKLQFFLFGLLLTSPINEGFKVNNTFSSFHFSAFAIQTNIFLLLSFFFFLHLPTSKHIPRKHFLYHFFSLGWQNWIRPANPTRHDMKLAGYGLKLNKFVSYSS